MKKISIISTILVIIDQVVKIIIDKSLPLNKSVEIINHFFSLTYVRNDGAAFSILSGNIFFLIIIALFALYIIYKYFIKGKELTNINIIIYTLIISGIIGNLIDRIIRGYVIDYFDFTIFKYHFAIFNIADIYIVIGCILLILYTLKEEHYGYNCHKRKWRKKNRLFFS